MGSCLDTDIDPNFFNNYKHLKLLITSFILMTLLSNPRLTL